MSDIDPSVISRFVERVDFLASAAVASVGIVPGERPLQQLVKLKREIRFGEFEAGGQPCRWRAHGLGVTFTTPDGDLNVSYGPLSSDICVSPFPVMQFIGIERGQPELRLPIETIHALLQKAENAGLIVRGGPRWYHPAR